MSKTLFTRAILVASLALAFVVPASYAADINEIKDAKASSLQSCKHCTCDGKCHACDSCNKSSNMKKNNENCDNYNEK